MRTNEYRCPHCHAVHTGATAPDDPALRPSNDDVSLCIKCGEWSKFVVNGDVVGLRKPTDDELLEIGHAPDCISARRAWNHLDRERKGRA